ncbi:MAG: beta-lactamase family protein [bacterium]|nr:beta-lactamase family protein [bacterium]
MSRRPSGRAFLVLLLLLIGCGGDEPPLPAIGEAPDRGELSAWRRFAIDRVLDYRVASGARAGFVALVAREGRVVYARTTGMADLEKQAPMTLDTRFHLASMSKAITAVAALVLVDDGRLGLDDPVAGILPAFASPMVVTGRDAEGEFETDFLEMPITVRHLLTFTSGIGGYAETDDPLDRLWRSPDIEIAGLGTLADRIDHVASRPLYERPGERWRYGWSADVLARVVEVASGQPFDAFLRERIFEPLGMTATGFVDDVPPDAPFARMYTHDEAGELVRETRFDEYYGRGWTPGGGGMVGTGPDYLRFAMMLANGGALEGVRVLREETVAEMTRLHVAEGVLADMGLEGLGWGLGVSVVADETVTLMPSTNGDYWWSGRFGTQFWISPANETVVVVMQQTETSEYSDLPWASTVVQVLAMP